MNCVRYLQGLSPMVSCALLAGCGDYITPSNVSVPSDAGNRRARYASPTAPQPTRSERTARAAACGQRTCNKGAREVECPPRCESPPPAPACPTLPALARACAVGLGLTLSIGCHADGAKTAKAGTAAVPACQSCHGAAGEGNAQAGFPRLAGLGAPYMQRQLAAFAEGTRVNAVMMPIAKAMSVDDRAEVSAYYAALPAPAGPAAAPPPAIASAPAAAASAQLGVMLATRGRWADHVPACEQCHGPGARGVGADFPALAGQSAAYLANQLTAWQTGARPPGPMGLMAVIAKKLSEAEVRAVADHYASTPARAAQ